MSTNSQAEPVIERDTFQPIGDATYSPEDNKLRLYPSHRLDGETYQRLKDAGFKWAPKQQLFVAPMWTPARYDLLIALCGDVGDEDRSMMDRAEAKSERISDLAERRERQAESAHRAVKSITDHIPFGQPILVGHHSERAARKQAEKIERGMDKAVKLWESAKYWSDRANDAIAHARYKELPSVRARRIRTIESERRKQLRFQQEAQAELDKWNAPGLTQEQALQLAGHSRLNVAKRQDGYYWTAYDVLRPEEQRYKDCPSMTVADVVAAANRAMPRAIARAQRWLDHYDLRLAYERAMLAESGGTVADRKAPEVGGAIKCWASPAFGKGWSYVVKVNKVSVKVLQSYGNGGAVYDLNIALDKITAILSKAEVESARAEGRLHEVDARGFLLADDNHTSRRATDTTTPPPAIDAAKDAEFKAMKETVRSGVRIAVAPDLYPTPDTLADRMVQLAQLQPGDTVLEPSAGTGNLLLAAARAVPGLATVAVEIVHSLANDLRQRSGANVTVHCHDFLHLQPEVLGTFDVVLMNPPFSNAADIAHIRHAIRFLAPGGRLVAICANGPRQQAQLRDELATHWEELPAGSFASAGTNVNTALLVIQKPY